jgi:starch-binding outer membrane protein, SusD/RagB family
MKNKIINNIAVAFFAGSLLLTACSKDYLEAAPTDRVDASNALLSVDNAKTALNGIHRIMFTRYNNQGEFGFGTVMINNDCLGEDYVFSGQSNGWWLSFYRWIDHRNANSSNCEFPYRFFYGIVSNANTLINGIDAVPGLTVDKNNVKGQALTYRAWAYFNLVQLYGARFDKSTPNTQLGVPLVLTNTTEGLERATVAAVYTQINADLTAAEQLLAAGTSAQADKSQLSKSVVLGLQARVALTQQNWSVAATKAAAARAGFSLMTAAQQLEGYNNWANPEVMWASRQIDDQTEFFTAYLAYISCNFNSTNIRTNPKLISSALYNTMATADVRRGLWVPAPTAANSLTPPGGNRAAFMTQKHRAKDAANSTGDILYMRVAEMFLIEAEAKARNESPDEPGARVALQGLMSNRVPGYVLSTSTGPSLLAEIMNSRRVELWGEGHRFYDLKRLNMALDRNGANHNSALALVFTMAAGSANWQYAIPQSELNANPKAVQNP